MRSHEGVASGDVGRTWCRRGVITVMVSDRGLTSVSLRLQRVPGVSVKGGLEAGTRTRFVLSA